ncbi:hypothetical protein, partial [Thiohalocapsa halophila]|uniref:hypothetical protein n=1 Tax=Thiohalocapsa halophila TaxID=69359 RepID=UPI0019063F44
LQIHRYSTLVADSSTLVTALPAKYLFCMNDEGRIPRKLNYLAGNAALIGAGALEAPGSIDTVKVATFFMANEERPEANRKLADREVSVEQSGLSIDDGATADAGSRDQIQGEHEPVVNDRETATEPGAASSSSGVRQPVELSQVTFYELFVAKAKELCGKEPRTPEQLVEALALNKTQLNVWLKQAVDKGELRKLAKPVRYEARSSKQRALALE